jgi:hypothetical protein
MVMNQGAASKPINRWRIEEKRIQRSETNPEAREKPKQARAKGGDARTFLLPGAVESVNVLGAGITQS